MKLKRSSWLLRYAFFFKGYVPYRKTSLCEVFWRCVLVTVVFAGLAVMCVSTLAVLYRSVQVLGWKFLLVISSALLLVGALIGAVKGVTSLILKIEHGEFEESVVYQGVMAVKHRFCPIIEIVEEPCDACED